VKALLLKDYMKLAVEEFPVPRPGPGEALLRVAACGICGSDVHGLDGSTGRRVPPLIMGHEAAGVIEAVGADVRDWRRGDRVTFDSTIYCGQCRFCRQGRINLCDDRRVLGVSCDEYRQHGAYAEYVVVPSRILYRLPEGLSFERAALVEPLSIALHAAERAGAGKGDTAAVVGAGMIGLLAVQALKARGCSPVIALDVDDGKLELARQLGADALVRSDDRNAVARVLEATSGAGADAVIEAAGLDESFQTAVLCARKGGVLALIGNLKSTVGFPLQVVVTRELSVLGSCASRGEYPECLEMIADGRVDVDVLTSAVAPLEEGPAYFDRLYRKEPGLMKVVLRP